MLVAPTQLPPPDTTDSYVFSTQAWLTCAFQTYTLQEVHRQVDAAFVRILQHLALGKVTEEVATYLRRLTRPLEGEHPYLTHIYMVNDKVNEHNLRELHKLDGISKRFAAEDSEDGGELNDGPLEAAVQLKVGAQVVCVMNLRAKKLINGDRGRVVRMEDRTVTVKFEEGREEVVQYAEWTSPGGSKRCALPLRLAWALTVHRCQGLVRDLGQMRRHARTRWARSLGSC